MARFQRWDPDTFLAQMHETVPDYERLQDETVAATGNDARRILELGTGTGETARRILGRHPSALLVGLDASGEILVRARAALPADRTELRVARLEDALPDGPFDASSRRSPSTTSTAPARRSSSGGSPAASGRADGSSSAISSRSKIRPCP